MKKIYFTLILLIMFCTEGISQSWDSIPNSPYPIYANRFDDMNFINDSTGFISQGSEVYKTTDKGVQWNLISLLDSTTQLYVRSIEFINDSVGFAGLLESAFPLSGNIYKTSDGGYSWTLLQNMQIQSSDGICGMAHYGNTLCAVGTWSGPAWFYRTNDLGLNWTKLDLSSFASGLVDVFMINNDTILVSGIADASHQQCATILKSFDGGVTWQRVFLASYPVSYCWKMFFRPNGLGIASVESGPPVIARTTNFGTTWDSISVYNSSNSDLGGIGLLNDTLGWVTCQSDFGTWETHDGGLTWNSVISPVYSGDRMVVLDWATALVCGSNSSLLNGASIYKYSLLSTGIQYPIAAHKKIHELLVYPNPAKQKIIVDANAGINTFGLLDILDEKGLIVQHISKQLFKKGKNSFSVNIQNLAAGNYKVFWRSNELFVTKNFVIAK